MDSVVAAVLDASIKFAVLAAVAGLATRAAGPDTAAAAHRVWLVVLVSPVLLMVSAALLPPVVLVIPRPQPEGSLAAGAAAAVMHWGPLVYGVVTAILLLRVASGLAEVSGLVRASVPLGRDGGVELRASRLRVPVTVGFFRPVILLPEDWRTMSAAETAAILQHEHAHVRRGDYGWGLLAAVLEACCWFHPAIWIAAKRVRWFAEVASDRDAAATLGALEYAGDLLRLAGRWSGERSVVGAVTVGAHSTLGRRVHLLLERAPGSRSRARALFAATLAILLLLASSFVIRLTLRGEGPAAAAAEGWAGHFQNHQLRHRATHDH